MKETIGQRLRNAREKRGMTQDQLAAESGIAQSTIQGIEDGSRGKRPSSLIELAHALGVDAYYLKTGIETLVCNDRDIDAVVKLMAETSKDGLVVMRFKAKEIAAEYPKRHDEAKAA